MTRLRIYPASAVTVDNTGWLSGDPCDWFGVTCDAGHVKDLHLRGNNLNGNLPAEPIRNLSTTMGHSTGLIREQCPVW